MIEVDIKNREKLQFLFKNMHDSIILTCLQGHMGRAWTDDLENPSTALLQVGDFCFVLGKDSSRKTDRLVEKILELTKLSLAFVVVNDTSLEPLFEKHYKENFKKIQRYAIKKRQEEFDLTRLRAIVEQLPKEYELHSMEGKWIEESLKEDWSSDFIVNFLSADDFEQRGIGRIITHQGKLVSGAASYSIYNEGIEIEIDTKEEYRRKGLALVAGAALILACRERGLYPSWDAANMISVHLAERLGYEFDKAYDTYMIRKTD